MLCLHGFCATRALPGETGASCGALVRDFASPRRLSASVPAPPQSVGSSIASGSQPGSNTIVALAVMSRPSVEPANDSVVDSKTGIDASIRRVAEKRKVMQAMSGPTLEGSSGPIGRHVM